MLLPASLQTFAMIPTCVFGGVLGQYIGRKVSMLVIAPIMAAGFICQAAAQDVVLLQFGRIIVGAAGGTLCGPTGVT